MAMDPYKETFSTWNKVASQYQEKFMGLDLYNKTYDFICNSIDKENAQLLEVGCGPGIISKYLLSKRPDFIILGIDIAPNMIELARQNNPTAVFEIMDVRTIDNLKTRYDGIICGFCLPYLSESDVKKLLVDSYSLLNEHGIIYLSFVEGDPSKSGFHTGSTGDKLYFFYHSTARVKKELLDHNFDILKEFEILYQKSKTETEKHIVLTAKKKGSDKSDKTRL